MIRVVLLACALGTPTAHAFDPEIETSGYLAPVFEAIFRPAARPVDQHRVGMSGSKAGLIFAGKVAPPWQFELHLVIGSDTFPALVDATPVDVDNNDTTDAIETSTMDAMSNIIEEATVSYVPID